VWGRERVRYWDSTYRGARGGGCCRLDLVSCGWRRNIRHSLVFWLVSILLIVILLAIFFCWSWTGTIRSTIHFLYWLENLPGIHRILRS